MLQKFTLKEIPKNAFKKTEKERETDGGGGGAGEASLGVGMPGPATQVTALYNEPSGDRRSARTKGRPSPGRRVHFPKTVPSNPFVQTVPEENHLAELSPKSPTNCLLTTNHSVSKGRRRLPFPFAELRRQTLELGVRQTWIF